MEVETSNQQLQSKYALFSNQTSGHSCIIKVTNSINHILKPLGSSEQIFYETTIARNPKKFLSFIPKYYGVYYPNQEEVAFFSKLAKRLIAGEENPESAKLKKKNKMHKSFLQKLYSERFSPQAYIKLEDLTHGMKTPRILDLKMGFKAYNLKKLHTQTKKYKDSTCGTDGFRFAGFRTYLKTRDEVFFRDKYWGFTLKQEDLIQAFALFFYDGEKIQKEIVVKFIDKIETMIESLEEMKGYLFYSCSLLLIYDEKSPEFNDFEEVQVKLIDFANVVREEKNEEQADQELVLGLKNIRTYLRKLIECESLVVNLYI